MFFRGYVRVHYLSESPGRYQYVPLKWFEEFRFLDKSFSDTFAFLPFQ